MLFIFDPSSPSTYRVVEVLRAIELGRVHPAGIRTNYGWGNTEGITNFCSHWPSANTFTAITS